MPENNNKTTTESIVPRNILGLWAWRRLIADFRDNGASEAANLVRKNLAAYARTYLNRRFDRQFNVDTAGLVQLNNLDCDSENKQYGVWYEPTPVRTLKYILSLLPSDLSDFTFIDFGSGKGRTILYASNYNFHKIIGVEFAKELHTIAERNISTYRSRRQKCFNIRSLCLDAVKFPLPEEDSVLYFFHPFREEVMSSVVDNIRQAYHRKPRRLVILYYHPQLDSFDRLTFLRKRDERPVPFDLSGEPCIYRRRISVYETVDDRIQGQA